MLKIYLGIMLFQFGGLILPGPDFAIVFRYGIIRGKKEGLLCAAGVSCAVFINLLVTYLIGTTLYAKYHILYIAFISIGLLYLFYVSIALIRNFFILSAQQEDELSTATLKGSSVITGMFTNLSNVKAIVFWSALLPLVNTLNTTFKILTWFSTAGMAWAWFSIVVMIFGHDKIRHAFLAKIHIFELIIGSAIFIFAGIIFYHSVILYFMKI